MKLEHDNGDIKISLMDYTNICNSVKRQKNKPPHGSYTSIMQKRVKKKQPLTEHHHDGDSQGLFL